MNSRPSIRDIAKRIGASHTTVSLALRNDPRITLKTRKRVKAAARDLGYHPDAVVSSLMARLRTLRAKPVQATLGFVTAWPTREGWRVDPHMQRFHFGAQRRATDLGYALDELWINESGMTGLRMTNILRTRGIRGLILLSLPVAGAKLNLRLDWKHFACVTKGLTVTHPRLHRVVSSHYEDMKLVLHELTRRRYRRIGLVISDELNARVDQAWLAALLLHQNDIPEDDRIPALIARAEDEEQLFNPWYNAHRPDVIVFSHLPIMNWTAKLGLRTPIDVGLVHLNWSPEVESLAGLDPDPENLGSAITDLLVGQIQANELGIPKHEKIVSVRGHWVAGSSVRGI